LGKAKEISTELAAAGIRVEIDSRREKPGWKYNFWEVRGVPVRLELGDRDVEGRCVMACRRDTGKKEKLSWDGLSGNIQTLLDAIHTNMYTEAKTLKESHTKQVTTFAEFIQAINTGNIALVPFCGLKDCESGIKKRSKEASKNSESDGGFGLTGAAKSLCIPFVQPSDCTGTLCFGECGKNAVSWCLFGRSY